MMGIDLNRPVLYRYASFRFFEKNEHHVSRFSRDYVLLLVYEGVLRFSEDGAQREVSAGEFYVQKKDCYQAGELASDAPQYLYVHFDAELGDGPDTLPWRGNFSYSALRELMEKIDTASHRKELYIQRQYLFFKLLLSLVPKKEENTIGQKIAEYIDQNIETVASLWEICHTFHYSKNYVIRIFKKEFGVTPFQYLNDARIKRAMYLLETTSKSVEKIAAECGYHTYSYFYRLFIQKNKTSPTKWREEKQKAPWIE